MRTELDPLNVHDLIIEDNTPPISKRIIKIAYNLICKAGRLFSLCINNKMTDLFLAHHLSRIEVNYLYTPIWFLIFQNFARIQFIRGAFNK